MVCLLRLSGERVGGNRVCDEGYDFETLLAPEHDRCASAVGGVAVPVPSVAFQSWVTVDPGEVACCVMIFLFSVHFLSWAKM
jgi:hypothetical protein